MDKKCEENKEKRYREVLQQCQASACSIVVGGGLAWITRHLYQEERVKITGPGIITPRFLIVRFPLQHKNRQNMLPVTPIEVLDNEHFACL